MIPTEGFPLAFFFHQRSEHRQQQQKEYAKKSQRQNKDVALLTMVSVGMGLA